MLRKIGKQRSDLFGRFIFRLQYEQKRKFSEDRTEFNDPVKQIREKPDQSAVHECHDHGAPSDPSDFSEKGKRHDETCRETGEIYKATEEGKKNIGLAFLLKANESGFLSIGKGE